MDRKEVALHVEDKVGVVAFKDGLVVAKGAEVVAPRPIERAYMKPRKDGRRTQRRVWAMPVPVSDTMQLIADVGGGPAIDRLLLRDRTIHNSKDMATLLVGERRDVEAAEIDRQSVCFPLEQVGLQLLGRVVVVVLRQPSELFVAHTSHQQFVPPETRKGEPRTDCGTKVLIVLYRRSLSDAAHTFFGNNWNKKPVNPH